MRYTGDPVAGEGRPLRRRGARRTVDDPGPHHLGSDDTVVAQGPAADRAALAVISGI